jgi:hypothetical protein
MTNSTPSQPADGRRPCGHGVVSACSTVMDSFPNSALPPSADGRLLNLSSRRNALSLW